jgi:class 3 adenylate cyclase
MKFLRLREFQDPELERKFRASVLLSSRIFPVSAGASSLAWFVAFLLQVYEKRVVTTSIGFTAARLNFFAPLLVTLIAFVVSTVPWLRNRALVQMHSFLLALIAVGMGVGECLINAMRGRPAATLWVLTSAVMPVVLQARAVQGFVFYHSVHCLTAAIIFFIVAAQDEYAQSQRHLYFPANWHLYLNTVLSGLMAIVVSTVMCDLMDRTQRRLFLQRWEAVRSVDDLRKAKERGQALCRNLLPKVYAEKVFSSEDGEVTYAEVSDLVGVLAIRFAAPPPPEAAPVALQTLKEIRATVSSLDDAFLRYSGGTVEKIGELDGLYIVATNVALTSSARLSGALDPGQRFVQLLRLSLSLMSVAGPDARAGVHIGRCASGVLGTSRLSFDIFGDAASMAMLLCEVNEEPMSVLCSSAARAMIPRRSARWADGPVVPGRAGPDETAFLWHMFENGLPGDSAPMLPHAVAAVPIALALAEPQSQSQSQSPRTEAPAPAQSPPSLIPIPTRSDSTTAVRTASEPEQKLSAEARKYLARGEAAQASRWSMLFADRALENTFQESLAKTLYTSSFGSVGAALFLAAAVQEATLPDGVRPASIILPLLAAALFATQAVLARQGRLKARQVVRLLNLAQVIGAVAMVVCLQSPGASVWAELRLSQMVVFMILVASAQTHIPLSFALILSQLASFYAFYFARADELPFQLINRRFVLVPMTAIAIGACALRFLKEVGVRKSFLLYTRSKVIHDEISAEVERGLKALGSCLPPSTVAATIAKVRCSSNNNNNNNNGSSSDSSDSGAIDAAAATESRVTGLDHFAKYGLLKAVPDILLNQWPVLTCRIHDLPALSNRLPLPALMRLLRQFLLVTEVAAAEEGCEVIKSAGGTVMICPRIEGRNSPGRLDKDNAVAIAKVGRRIVASAAYLSTFLSANDKGAWESEPDEIAVSAAVAVGSCVGGVIGIVKPQFALIGPCPSQSLHLLSSAQPGQLRFSPKATSMVNLR